MLKKYRYDVVQGTSRRLTRFLGIIGGFLCKSQGKSTTEGTEMRCAFGNSKVSNEKFFLRNVF